ncbi:MAG: class I SAM-dependent methyltransferase [Candidatus Palauibacterales bacterium]|nr:class I SAM-dependent methyltransferase [Candidatus Palauibacterales bacterium]
MREPRPDRRPALRRFLLPSLLVLLLALAAPPGAPAQEDPDAKEPGAPYVPTPMGVVTEMLELAGITARDTVYDLGSGDGRLPITAARLYGSRGLGVELDSGLVARSRRHAREAGVDSLVRFVRGDLFETDIRPATVLTLYLFPGMNERLRPRILREMEPGNRVVAHDFSMGEWDADSVVTVRKRGGVQLPDGLFDGREEFGDRTTAADTLLPDVDAGTGRATLYLWVIPADVGGTWAFRLPGGESGRVRIDQRFQELRAAAVGGGIDTVSSARVHADSVEIRLVADGETLRLRGTVDGERMQGRSAAGEAWSARRTGDTDASILEWEG